MAFVHNKHELKFILRWRKQHKWEKWLEWGMLRSGRDCSQLESTFGLKGTAVIQGQPLLCASCNCHVTQECRPVLISSSNFSRESRNPAFVWSLLISKHWQLSKMLILEYQAEQNVGQELIEKIWGDTYKALLHGGWEHWLWSLTAWLCMKAPSVAGQLGHLGHFT